MRLWFESKTLCFTSTFDLGSSEPPPKDSGNTTSSSDGVFSLPTEKSTTREVCEAKSNPISPRCNNFRRRTGAAFGALSLKGQLSKEGYCSPASQSSSLSRDVSKMMITAAVTLFFKTFFPFKNAQKTIFSI